MPMKSAPTIPPEYLPESVQYLMTVISINSALLLVKTRGGTHIEVPKTAKAGHWLADLIGMEDFKKLADAFGCTALEIPRCAKLIKLAQDIKILQDKKAGISNTSLALKYRMTERRIRSALRRIEQHEQKAWINEIQAYIAYIL